MGQIVGTKAKPKRANLNALSLVGTPALGEYVLVSSDNSMSADGQGNFDCYIVGDGTTAATALPLHSIVKGNITSEELDGVNGKTLYNFIYGSGDPRIVFNITGFGTDGASGGVTGLGQTYYNTSSKLLRRCIDYKPKATSTYETVSYAENTIYHNQQNNKYYEWNGEELVLTEYVRGESFLEENSDLYPTEDSENVLRSGGTYDYLHKEVLTTRRSFNSRVEGYVFRDGTIKKDGGGVVFRTKPFFVKQGGNIIVICKQYSDTAVIATNTNKDASSGWSVKVLGAGGSVTQTYTYTFEADAFVIVSYIGTIDDGVDITLTSLQKYVSDSVIEGDDNPVSGNAVYEEVKNAETYKANVFPITGFGTAGTSAGISAVGDVFYNTNSGQLRKCIEYNPSGTSYFVTIPFDNDIYYYNKGEGKYYMYSNGGLVEADSPSIEYESISNTIKPSNKTYTDEECKQRFYVEMNKKASVLGMTTAEFYEPAGNQQLNQMSVLDILRLVVYCSGIRAINDVWQMKSAVVSVLGGNARNINVTTTVTNTSLENNYVILGGKTGSIPNVTQSLGVVVQSKNSGKVYACADINTSLTAGVKFTHIKNVLDFIEGASSEPTFNQGGIAVIELPAHTASLYNRFDFNELFLYGDENVFTPASTTKMMTAIILCDNIQRLDTRCIIHNTDIQPPTGSTFYAGDIYTYKDALRCLMLESSNTSAHVIARCVGKILLDLDNDVYQSN